VNNGKNCQRTSEDEAFKQANYQTTGEMKPCVDTRRQKEEGKYTRSVTPD